MHCRMFSSTPGFRTPDARGTPHSAITIKKCLGGKETELLFHVLDLSEKDFVREMGKKFCERDGGKNVIAICIKLNN